MFFSNWFGNNVNGQKLKRYTESSGGGMNGGHSRLVIERYDETHALYSTEKSKWYAQIPEVEEYLVDVTILDDIQKVFTANKMNKWNNKEFSDVFVADGESYSYSFDFDDDSVRFSSQFYPEKYSQKLQQLDDVINRYADSMEKIPGLVLPETGEESGPYIPCSGGVGIYVYNYATKYLTYKIVNDTDENVEYSCQPVIRRLYDESVVVTGRDSGTATVWANGEDEEAIKLNSLLDAGFYELTVGAYSCVFEIQ